MKRLLLIDDEEKLRNLLARVIGVQGEGFQVDQAGSLKAARQKLTRAQFDVVLCDVRLSDGSGVDFVHEVRQIQPLTEIILLTAYGNIPDGVQAIKNGAFDYIIKGNDNNRIIPLISRAYEKVLLAKRVQQLEQRIGQRYSFDNIIGSSKQILEAISLGKKVAQTDTTVLLLGETGTGKEVFAQAIHQASKRNLKPFVALNCATFSRELMESELFGHKEGAFTGATKDKRGLFEEANGGSLFLDEVGELPVDLQAKLLRVLETGEFLRVGENTPVKADIRIIAATNRDLQTAIDKGEFRSDLYYRLSVFIISLPALRERKRDIAALAESFVRLAAERMNRKTPIPTGVYIEALERHLWKGNIRELKNVIERSVILADGSTLDTDVLPVEFNRPADDRNVQALSAFSLASAERNHIQKVLDHTGGNKAEAARLLQIGVATLYRKIEEYNLS